MIKLTLTIVTRQRRKEIVLQENYNDYGDEDDNGDDNRVGDSDGVF